MNPQNLFAMGQQQEEARRQEEAQKKAQEEEIRRQVEERLRAEAAQQQAAAAAAPVTTPAADTWTCSCGKCSKRKVLSGMWFQETGTKTCRRMEMCMWQYCHRKILSGMRSTEACRRKTSRTERMDLFLRNCQSGQILYELWSKKTGGCTVISL